MVFKFKFLFFFIPFASFIILNLFSNENEPLKRVKINIISNKNGVGLSKDIDILIMELNKLGADVQFTEDTFFKPHPKVDINLFVQPVPSSLHFFFSYADKNYLIPNPEWCYFSTEEISKFDKILCKTKEAERVFKPLNHNTVYLGFTCTDCFDMTIEKNYHQALHLAGASIQKGSDRVVKCWVDNPQFPKLFLLKHKNPLCFPPVNNIHQIQDYLTEPALRTYQNNIGLHIAPSETEGFGHYIVEGMSCEAIVVTTDAPPMNEFISDRRCLVPFSHTAPLNLATNYYIEPAKLETTVANLLSLPKEELQDIGKKNRERYLEMDGQFKKRLKEIFKEASIDVEDEYERIFTSHYINHEWGENPSGDGSQPQTTELYRFFLEKFLKDNGIKTVIDFGCGDWSFSKLMDWKGIDYLGIDVNKEVIKKLQHEFGSKHLQFLAANGLKMRLPKADLLICKDVLQHFPNNEIALLLLQLGEFKHCIFVNDVNQETLTSNNEEIHLGGFRCVDLTQAPFNLTGKKILTFPCGSTTKQALHIQR